LIRSGISQTDAMKRERLWTVASQFCQPRIFVEVCLSGSRHVCVPGVNAKVGVNVEFGSG
jgi:hypothetical protein